jgi:sodium-dependent dicarboxylate transporter 2/3/5
VVLALCYFVITKLIFPNNIKNVKGSEELIRNKLASMGKVSRIEKLVLLVFFITSFGWIFRPYINAGLNYIFYHDDISRDILDDTTIAMLGGLLMFSIPTNIKKGEFLLTWEDTKRLPWGILILFGGGMCLAKSLEDVGLIQMIGSIIADQGEIRIWVLVSILAFISLFLTEIMSNVALATIFVPVVFGIADGLGYNPLVLALPVTFAASCAFTMPVSTPPNAILFASGNIELKDMMRAGIVLNFLALITIIALSLLLV